MKLDKKKSNFKEIKYDIAFYSVILLILSTTRCVKVAKVGRTDQCFN